MNRKITFLITYVFFSAFILACSSINHTDSNSDQKNAGAYYSGKYPNLFKDLLQKNDDEINLKVNTAFKTLFYGDDNSERVYYPVENEMAYIKDVWNNDVRTEGLSYGMMIALQIDKKEEFDRIWKWTKTHLQHQHQKRKFYFGWHADFNGAILDSNSASDGEEWFVTCLFFASARWGNGEGIYNYKKEAQNILDGMLNKVGFSDDRKDVTNMFNKKEKQVVFVPAGEADDFTDPSYHLPHFYELWARWADKEKKFWCEVAKTSREYWKKTVNQNTGLAPEYSKFDGTPHLPWGNSSKDFRYDAWRVGANVALDYIWFAKDNWNVEQSDRLLNFFYSQGITKYGALFTLDGKELDKEHRIGLLSMNAVAALASSNENRKEFVQALWDAQIPTGKGRYYDGLLYMLALLQVSGNYKIYDPVGKTIEACN